MKTNIFKVITFNIFMLSGVIVFLFYNILQPILLNDFSKMSFVIAVLMLFNVILATYDCFKPANWVGSLLRHSHDRFLYLGLIGTLIGFIYIISIVGGSVNGTEDLNTVITAFLSGMKTSFNATLMGIIAYIWTGELLYLKRKINND